MHANNFNSQTWPWFQPPPTNQQPLPLLPYVDPFVMQQLLGSQPNTIPWCEGNAPMQHFYSLPFYIGPVYQGIAQQHQHQYRAPSSGPSRNQHSKGRQKTEARYPNHLIHESSGTIARDRSTGVHLGHARMGANDNTGAGGAWRPPSRNPSMVDHNSGQQMRIKPYDRDRSSPSRTRRHRTDQVDLSVYEIPIVDSASATAGGPSISAVIPAPAPIVLSTWASAPALPSAPPTSTPASATSTSMASSEMSNEDAKITTDINVQEQPVEEDDFDTISLGSETDYQY